MKIDWAFLRLAAICWGGATALATYPLLQYASREVMESVLASVVISWANLLLGFVFIKWGFEKSNTTFLKIVLGGSVVRLLLLVTVVLLLMKVYTFHSLSLMLSLLVCYSLNLVLEIYLLQKKVSLKH